MKADIVLFNPPYSKAANKLIYGSSWISPPMSLLYLAGALKKEGYTVKIVDLEITRMSSAEIKKFVEDASPTAVGVTSTTPSINRAFEICEITKKIDKEILTVLGGPHPTAMPQETLSNEYVDVVVEGEGEKTLCEIMNCLLTTTADDIKKVAGAYIKKDGNGIIYTGRRAMIADLDLLSFPEWDLIDIKRYHHPLSRSGRIAPILTSRGCPFECSFCNSGIFNRTFRARTVKNVINELEMLIDRYHINEIYFIDDNFTLDRARVKSICDEIILRKWNIRWATPNGINVNTIDHDLIRLMKKSGCYSLSFGIESANRKTLDYVKKNQDPEKIRDIFRICRSEGIETVAFIIIGFPTEQRADIDTTLRFLKEIKADIVDIHMLIPLPGTRLYRELLEKNYIIDKNWDNYVFHRLPVYRTAFFSPKEIRAEYKRFYIKYHLRPSYFLMRLGRIRSVKDIYNNIRGFITILGQAFS